MGERKASSALEYGYLMYQRGAGKKSSFSVHGAFGGGPMQKSTVDSGDRRVAIGRSVSIWPGRLQETPI